MIVSNQNCIPRWAYLAAGYGLFAVGAVGIVLPLLPTTIFWIGAAVCFAKSSPAMYRRLLSWPRIGPAIHDFLVHGIIGAKAKHAAFLAMAVCAIVLVVIALGSWAMTLGLLGIAIGAVIVATRPASKAPSAAPYRGAGGAQGCPFLAHVQIPFPGNERFTA